MTKRIIIGTLFVAFALLKLCDMWNILHWEWMWRQPWTEYVCPVVTICVGVDLLFSGRHRNHRDRWLQRPVPASEEGKRIVCDAKFGGDEYVYHGESFHGACLRTHCGAILLDLRDAVITEDEAIDISNFIGGVELYVPTTVNIIVRSRSFIGGVGDETSNRVKPDAPSLHIVASNFIGGVSIKN